MINLVSITIHSCNDNRERNSVNIEEKTRSQNKTQYLMKYES